MPSQCLYGPSKAKPFVVAKIVRSEAVADSTLVERSLTEGK